ncbi:uncharacterized protein LOC135216214 [Macrobrachium nipponense]|uniref:uncharacterized protein LOC135216214 n=1 Tax=Macrobrachium nipponense TaxID=159736 RepID=UPI0030C7F666
MENRDIPDLSTPLPRSNNNEEVYDVNLEETSVPDEFMKPLYMSTTEPVNDNEYEDDVFNASLGRFMIAVKSPDYQYTSTPEPVDDERVPSDEYDDDEMFDESLGRIMVSIKSPHYQIHDVANRSNNDDPNPDTMPLIRSSPDYPRVLDNSIMRNGFIMVSHWRGGVIPHYQVPCSAVLVINNKIVDGDNPKDDNNPEDDNNPKDDDDHPEDDPVPEDDPLYPENIAALLACLQV